MPHEKVFDYPLTKTYSKDVSLRLFSFFLTPTLQGSKWKFLHHMSFQLILRTSKRWLFWGSKFQSLHDNSNLLHVGKATGWNQSYNLTSYGAPCIFTSLTVINWFQRSSVINWVPSCLTYWWKSPLSFNTVIPYKLFFWFTSTYTRQNDFVWHQNFSHVLSWL